jgi:hypothetical protein
MVIYRQEPTRDVSWYRKIKDVKTLVVLLDGSSCRLLKEVSIIEDSQSPNSQNQVATVGRWYWCA